MTGGDVYRGLGDEELDHAAWIWAPPRKKALWRRMYSALIPWADDYTTFVWAARPNLWGDDIPLEDATFSELRVKKIRVRPKRDLVLDDAGRIIAIRKQDDHQLPQWTNEEKHLHALLIQQLRAFWQREEENGAPEGEVEP